VAHVQAIEPRHFGAASERRNSAMTTTPDVPVPDDGKQADAGPPQPKGAPGAELGMSEEMGGTFEPEEDPEAGD
jgi:hypothetical protein